MKILHALLLNIQSASHNVSGILKCRIIAGLAQTKDRVLPLISD